MGAGFVVILLMLGGIYFLIARTSEVDGEESV